MERDREDLKTTVRPEFVADVPDVIAHSGGTDAEHIRNARGALAHRQVLEYFSLALAQWQRGWNIRNGVRRRRWSTGGLRPRSRSFGGSGQQGL